MPFNHPLELSSFGVFAARPHQSEQRSSRFGTQDVPLLGLMINLSCLPNTVSVPEEHPDVPVGVQRCVWHEEKRAV